MKNIIQKRAEQFKENASKKRITTLIYGSEIIKMLEKNPKEFNFILKNKRFV